MFRPLEVFIGLRYTRAKRRNHFISFISLISMLGIALGVTALITVLSVMNGFEKELRERILGVVSHATVQSDAGALADWRRLLDGLERRPGVVGVAPFIHAEGMISRGDRVSGAILQGVLPEMETAVSELPRKMVAGELANLTPGGYGIILGQDLAYSLGATVGDQVVVITPQGSLTPAGFLPRLKRFTVVGIFSVGMYEYDSALALMQLDDAATLYRLGDGVKDGNFLSTVLEDLSTFSGRDAGDDLRAVIDGELGMPRAEAAGDALNENFGVGFNEDGHVKF